MSQALPDAVVDQCAVVPLHIVAHVPQELHELVRQLKTEQVLDRRAVLEALIYDGLQN